MVISTIRIFAVIDGFKIFLEFKVNYIFVLEDCEGGK